MQTKESIRAGTLQSSASDLATAHAHLTSARALIGLALQAAHDHLDAGMPDVLMVLDREIEDLSSSMQHHHNHALAKRLGIGFNYDPDG